MFVELVRTLVLSRHRLDAAWAPTANPRLVGWSRVLLRHHLELVTTLCTSCAKRAVDARWIARGLQAMAPLASWVVSDGKPPPRIRRAWRQLSQVEDTLLLPMAALLMTDLDWQALAPRVAACALWLQSGPQGNIGE